jgi:hypothetical protein
MDIEQNETTEQDPNAFPDRDELIAAAQEAAGAEPEKPAEEPKPPPAEEPGGEPDEPKIAAVIRAREKAYQERLEAESFAEEVRRKAQQDAEHMLAEARRQAQEAFDAEVASRRKRFDDSPTEALRALGKDPQEIADAIAREGTAEWRELRKLQQELAEAKKSAASAGELKKELDAWREEQRREREASVIEKVRADFLGKAATEEKTPYLYKRYDPDEIFVKANELAAKWKAAGVPFDHEQVAEYLEWEAKKRILGPEASRQVSGAAANAAGKRPQGSANGTRTLSAAATSERRTSPKPIHEMTPEEEREALIEEVRKARQLGGG